MLSTFGAAMSPMACGLMSSQRLVQPPWQMQQPPPPPPPPPPPRQEYRPTMGYAQHFRRGRGRVNKGKARRDAERRRANVRDAANLRVEIVSTAQGQQPCVIEEPFDESEVLASANRALHGSPQSD